MEEHLATVVAEAADPRLIHSIHNYCHRWRERCPFTDRCLVFRETSHYERDHPDSTPLEQVEDSFQKTFGLLAAWCEREGIDFETIRAEAQSDKNKADIDLVDESIDADPLVKAAREYGRRAFDIVRGLDRLAMWSPRVRAAVEVHRALHGLGEAKRDEIEEYGLQSDWNLTAKAARMAIAECCRAWAIVLDAGNAPPQSGLRELVGLLNSIDTDLAGRFPHAMERVRPGFDEPDVAAGALTTLECFEPRSCQRSER